jgi:hypothetical protein
MTGRGTGHVAGIDVLDLAHVSAVDSPGPGGFELPVFGPGLDPDGHQPALVTDIPERAL